MYFNTSVADTIPVMLISSNQYCSDTLIKNIMIHNAFSVFVPNAFTPNGDGLNDDFFPDGLNLDLSPQRDYEFLIFDRWGELIFSSTQPYQRWNGKRNNNMRDAQIDVYVWKLTYVNTVNNKRGEKMGQVSLIR